MLELRFFHECDHRTKSEPLIIDESGIGETSLPLVNSSIRILEENIEKKREPIVRSITDDVDSLSIDYITNIDLVVQEITRTNGFVEIRKYQHGRDYILTGNNLVLWKDSALLKPNPGDLYFVDYRYAKTTTSYRTTDAQHIKLIDFDRRHSYVIDYNTLPGFCTKCTTSGSIKNGIEQPDMTKDLRYDTSGDFRTIQGVEKLKQDLIRAVLTIRGSNPREPFYGTSIEQSIGTAQRNSMFASFINQEIRRSLGLLKTLQNLQREVMDNVDPTEILDKIISVDVVSDGDMANTQPMGTRSSDPTAYIVSIVVQNLSNNLVDFFVPMDVFSKTANHSDLPIIEVYDVYVSSINRDSAVITWRTNISTDSIIDFGTTDELSNREIGDFGSNHYIALAGLSHNSLYHFKVVTRNRGFLFGSELRSFKTLP